MRIPAILILALTVLLPVHMSASDRVESNRKERNAITEGNRLYNEGRYRAAMLKYQESLKYNPSSAAGRYNLGLSQIRLGSNPSDTTQAAKDILSRGVKEMEQVARMGAERPQLASKANYNLGNVSFNSEDYKNALTYYKQALRLNPEDNAAKRNLRITQLKLQNQDQNQDKDDKQEQNQNQDQNQDQQQQQQQQQQDQNQEQQQQQQQQQEQNLNQQTADQILQAMENKENQTRARVGTGNQGEKSTGRNRNRKNW